MFESLADLPQYYVLASTLGLVGQGLRGVLGLIKHLRETGEFAFSPYFFVTSLFLGVFSGLMGALVYDLAPLTPSSASPAQLWNDRNFVLMAISAGYFGADVIEGVLGRHLPHKG